MSPSSSQSQNSRTLTRTELYHYDKLEGSNDIRLVVLPPGSFYSKVCCDIIHVNLAEAPDYEALSYTWADANDDKSLTGTILCGPELKKIPITRNCETALRHLRLERETRVLWIDAICINQSTLEERNHQVSIMSKIYSTALRVVVYLGERTRDSDELMDYMSNKIVALLSSAPIQQAKSLLRRPWFTRLWVFQEIMLARRAVVMCGDRTVLWRTLAGFYKTYLYPKYDARELNEDWNDDSFARILLHYGLKGIQATETLPELYHATQQGKATDPRDKVFALLGVVENPGIDPDYGLSTTETFENLAVYFLERYRVILPERNLENPSWASDWAKRPLKPIFVGEVALLKDRRDGAKRLVIRGQHVVSGCVGLTSLRAMDNIRVIDGILEVVDNRTVMKRIKAGHCKVWEKDRLVQISEHHCVVLRPCSGGYAVVCGAGALQHCETHDSNDHCGPDCSPTEIKLRDSEKFVLL